MSEIKIDVKKQGGSTKNNNNKKQKMDNLAKQIKNVRRELQSKLSGKVGNANLVATVRRRKGASRGNFLQAMVKRLLDPFNNDGLKVPDGTSDYTITYKLTATMRITIVAGAVASFQFFPNPLYTLQISFAAGTSNVTVTGYPVTLGAVGGITPTSNDFKYIVVGGMYKNNLIAALSSYRVVSAGLKMKNRSASNQTQPDLIFARVPCVNNKAYANLISNAANSADSWPAYFTGLAPANLGSQIAALRKSEELTGFDIMGGKTYKFVTVGKRPGARQFYTTGDNGLNNWNVLLNGFTGGDFLMVNSTTGVPASNSGEANIGMDGFDALFGYIDNGGSSSSCILQVHTVMQLEGAPPQASTTGGNYTSSAAPLGSESIFNKVSSMVEAALNQTGELINEYAARLTPKEKLDLVTRVAGINI